MREQHLRDAIQLLDWLLSRSRPFTLEEFAAVWPDLSRRTAYRRLQAVEAPGWVTCVRERYESGVKGFVPQLYAATPPAVRIKHEAAA